MKKIGVIGAGISGVSAAKLLSEKYEVIIFEKESKIGGLIKCEDINGNLFHRVGGHVFNTKIKKVADWFWKHFDQERDFLETKRNAKILLNNQIIGYPLEDYLYQLDDQTFDFVLEDLLQLISRSKGKSKKQFENFEEFLRGSFGDSLYEIYFGPYNQKIWNCDLKEIPLDWLEGKLPMPDIKEIFKHNIRRRGESEMVHSSFFYPKQGGSQFIIDVLSNGLSIHTNSPLLSIKELQKGFLLNNEHYFDFVVYTGDVRQLNSIYQDKEEELTKACQNVEGLKSNATSNIFCETDDTDISWLYLPDLSNAHRIIYTGNFSINNSKGSKRKTCVVEFSGKYEPEEMKKQIKLLPGNLTPLAFNYEPSSYIIHEKSTKDNIAHLKSLLEPKGFYLSGRFAEWEYYNMDKAIEASMGVKDKIVMSYE